MDSMFKVFVGFPITMNRGALQVFSVSIRVSKKNALSQQALVSSPNLGVRCKKWFKWTSGNG